MSLSFNKREENWKFEHEITLPYYIYKHKSHTCVRTKVFTTNESNVCYLTNYYDYDTSL